MKQAHSNHNCHKVTQNFVIQPKIGHFHHFNQERHLLKELLLIQNQIQL
jgi:hypothetical protein